MDTPGWHIFRTQFPGLKNKTYLNTAGGGAMSRSVARAGREYYTESEEFADTYWDVWLGRAEAVRADVASFVGAETEDIAFVQSTSLGVNILAHQFAKSVHVLALDQEFPSCTTPWLSAGHKVSFVPTPHEGSVSAEQLDQYLTSEIDVLILSSVQFANGFRADLGAIGRLCRDRGVLFLVDATQSICAYEIDIERDCIDALVFSGYKWATAGYGIAAMSVSEPVRSRSTGLTGWRSARLPYLLENDRLDMTHTAIRHEMGHPSFPGIFCLGAAIKLFSDTGIESVSTRIDALSDRVRAGVSEAGWRIRSSSEAGSTSGITLVDIDDASFDDASPSASAEASSSVAARLRERGIWVSARDGGIRVSVHAYNSEEEIDVFCSAMASLR